MTAFEKSSIEYSESVSVNNINGLFHVIDDPPIRHRFIVICNDSAAFCIREKFVS